MAEQAPTMTIEQALQHIDNVVAFFDKEGGWVSARMTQVAGQVIRAKLQEANDEHDALIAERAEEGQRLADLHQRVSKRCTTCANMLPEVCNSCEINDVLMTMENLGFTHPIEVEK